MPEDYWSSQAATLAERSIGYDEATPKDAIKGCVKAAPRATSRV